MEEQTPKPSDSVASAPASDGQPLAGTGKWTLLGSLASLLGFDPTVDSPPPTLRTEPEHSVVGKEQPVTGVHYFSSTEPACWRRPSASPQLQYRAPGTEIEMRRATPIPTSPSDPVRTPRSAKPDAAARPWLQYTLETETERRQRIAEYELRVLDTLDTLTDS